MTINDVLIATTNLLNLESERDILSNVTEENWQEVLESDKTIKRLYNLAIFSLKEICYHYVPIVEEITCESVDKKISISSLTNYLKILKIFKDGYIVPFKLKNGDILLKEDGLYTIQYSIEPNVSKLLDELTMLDGFGPDILIMAISAYYSIGVGMYDDFNIYHEKYIEKAESIKQLGLFDTPSRRWV